MELLERYIDDPNRDQIIAREMGWYHLLDKDGEKLVVIVKATFEQAKDGAFECAPEDGMRGLRAADVPWGKPEIPSIAYPADICLRKPGTDVIVVAKAYAPAGKTVTTFDVLVQVGSAIKKPLRIFGPRVWTQGGLGLTKSRAISTVQKETPLERS